MQSNSNGPVLLAVVASIMAAAACTEAGDDANSAGMEPAAAPVADSMPDADGGASCSVDGGQIAASDLAGNHVLPCDFDVPASWIAVAGYDSMVASMMTDSCEGCMDRSRIQLNIGSDPNANADRMEESWQGEYPVVGSGRCGRGTVTFYGLGEYQSTLDMGSVMFHVEFSRGKHSGSAQFRCPVPGEWKVLRDHFINTFRENPDTTFPGL